MSLESVSFMRAALSKIRCFNTGLFSILVALMRVESCSGLIISLLMGAVSLSGSQLKIIA